MKKIRDISFRTRVILVLEVVVVTILIVVGVITYQTRQALIREVSQEKLLAIASSSAAVIDPEKVAAIQTEADTASDNYLELKGMLQKIKMNNPEVDDIYLMKKSAYRNILKFIVSANDTQDRNGNGAIEENEVGVDFEEEYEISAFPEMAKAFEAKTTDKQISCDKWGCWLSGYAPIFNEKGEAIAIVGVDIPAETILAYERDMRMVLWEVLGVISIFFPLFLFFYLQYALRPIDKITKSIAKFSSDFKTRIDIVGDNEFGMIAKTFNQMALELEILHTQMEKKVKAKTNEIVACARNITEDKAKEEAFLDSVGEGIIAIDKKGKVILVNRQTEVILGRPSKELLGKTTAELYEVEDEFEKKLSNKEKPLQKTITSGEKISGKYFCVHSGRKIPVFITASPVISENKLIGAILVFRDITKENEIDKAKTEFVSLASHQLRTPLSIISWHSEALLEDQRGFSEKQKTYLEKISHATNRMVELVRALLNTSRLEMGTFSIETKEIDLVRLAENLVKDLSSFSSIQNISIEKKFSGKKIMLKGDQQLITMIFQNLLTNAIKYSKRDGKVVLEISQKSPNIVIRVVDQGIGITDNQKSDIFTRFFRADNAKEKDAEGTGLGLYIIKAIIEHSGGTIKFDSIENKGTTFTVILPESGMPKKEGTRKLI
ncbi:MAG: ATP-binding protein [Parcubacteria group bacterium]|jgi:PAS domain S-box-containing protein